MKTGIRIIRLVITSCLSFSYLCAQVNHVQNGKVIKWEAIKGKDNEFVFFIPEGYISDRKDDLYLGKRPGGGVHVSQMLTLTRYINGVILVMQYYEGRADQIQESLLEREDLQFKDEVSTGNFKIRRLYKKTGSQVMDVQQFASRNHLYVLKAISTSENDPSAKAFFASVRLVGQNGMIAPNAPAGVSSTSLPNLVERDVERKSDSDAISTDEVDRQPFIIRTVSPAFTFEMRRGLGPSIRLKVKALFSSSGTVTSVTVIESPSKLLEKAAIEAAKQTIFIPAEKNGKFVSVYKVLDFSFEITGF